jgi:predicted DCC family thiol-disulfide oxidoreductase YuxK
MQPIFIYDGECGFCKKCAKRWKHRIGDHVRFLPYQEKGYRFASIPLCHFEKAPHFANEHGKMYAGARAVVELFARGKGPGWQKWFYKKVPGGRWLSEFAYKKVSSCKECADKITNVIWRD